MFTSGELRDLAARASTIDERLSGGYVRMDTVESADKAAQRLEAWCKSATDGDYAIFEMRLARDGLQIETIKLLLGDVKLANSHPVPSWVQTFSWASEVLQSGVSAVSAYQFVNSNDPIPFEELFVPLVIEARKRRDRLTESRSVCLSETAHAALQRALLRRLCNFCAPTLLEGFAIFKMIQHLSVPKTHPRAEGEFSGRTGAISAYKRAHFLPENRPFPLDFRRQESVTGFVR